MYRKLSNLLLKAILFLGFILSVAFGDQKQKHQQDSLSHPSVHSSRNEFKEVSCAKAPIQIVTGITKLFFKDKNSRSSNTGSAGWYSDLKQRYGKLVLLIISVIIILKTFFYFRRRGKENRLMTTTRLSVMNPLVQQACRYIEKKYDWKELTSEHICTELVTGKAYLEAIFKKELGMQIDEVIDRVRVNNVKVLLNKNPQASLTDIASGCGFSDLKACASTFEKICDIELETYQKNLITNQITNR